MSVNRPYSEESVLRAIRHHEITGTIRTYSPPSEGRRTHRIVSRDGMEIEVRTLPELYAVVWGIKCGLDQQEAGN